MQRRRRAVHAPYGRSLRASRPRARAPSAASRTSFARLRAQHLARIEDAMRIERLLDGAHQFELNGRGVALALLDLEPPDAVLGAEAAGIFGDQIVNGALHG